MNSTGRVNKFYTHKGQVADVVLSVVTTCVLVGGHQRFGGNCCLLLQCRSESNNRGRSLLQILLNFHKKTLSRLHTSVSTQKLLNTKEMV
jgi:hypothetical protein